MPPAQPIALVIGAGPHVGTTVAHTLYEQGYIVILGSRRKQVEVEHMDKFIPIAIDAANPTSIKHAFDEIVRDYGYPTVVVYNAASFVPAPEPMDPLSLSSSHFHDSACIGAGVFSAAHEAIKGFRHEYNKLNPKVFIVTGNALAFQRHPSPAYLSLTVQKSMEAQIVEALSDSYRDEGFRFFFASLVSSTGGLAGPEFHNSAATHAKVYWELISRQTKGPEHWDYRFTLDGERYTPTPAA